MTRRRFSRARWGAWLTCVATLVLGIASCGSDAQPESQQTGDQALTVVYGSTAIGIEDFPTYLAWKALERQGVKVTFKFVSDSSLAIPTLIKGDAQFAIASPPTMFDANATASDIVGFFDYKRPTWLLAATPDIKSISDLSGKTIAVNSEASFTNAITDKVISDNHLTDVEKIFVAGSDVRAQSLASGKIDATIVTFEDVANLNAANADAVSILANFSKSYPYLTTGIWAANKSWLDSHGELANKVGVAMLTAVRKVAAHPGWAVKQAQTYYKNDDPALVKQIMQRYISEDVWRVNGGPDRGAALKELRFYHDAKQSGGFPATDSSVERLFDFRSIDAALRQLGRK